MYKRIKMHRTQIYFEEDLDERKKQPQVLDFSDFSGMWENREITQASIREKVWK